MTDWNAVREDFPLVSECTYLDTASASPTPPFVRRAVEGFFDEKARGYLDAGWNDVEAECRRLLADHAGASPGEIVFVSNTTEGINQVAAGIPWEPDDEVLVTDVNFPSNVYPWLALRERDVSVRVIESDGGRLPPSTVLDALSGDSRLVALPHVSSASGYRVDLGELGGALADRGVALAVDGIQGFGYLRPDLAGVDAYAAATFKWLLGPFGLGVLYLDAATAEGMTPPFVGYANTRAGADYRYDGYELRDGPRKFQYAHANYPAIYCLRAALEYLDDLGPDAVEERVLDLAAYLRTELDGVEGVDPITPPGDHGGIVAVRPPAGTGASDLADALAERDVHVAARGGALRASVHVYNNRTDVDALVAAVRDLI